ncbi:hypothetical protein D3C83_176090 [compost metagenome]
MTSRMPSVRMMRLPPEYVPMPITKAEESLTQKGTSRSGIEPAAKSASVITPIVFCASFAP